MINVQTVLRDFGRREKLILTQGWGGKDCTKGQQWFPKETHGSALARGGWVKASGSEPTGHPPTQVSHLLSPKRKVSELFSKKNSMALFHFILKIRTNFEFHSTGYQRLFCYNNFNIIGLNFLSLRKIISSGGLCAPDIPLLICRVLFQKFSLWYWKFRYHELQSFSPWRDGRNILLLELWDWSCALWAVNTVILGEARIRRTPYFSRTSLTSGDK